MHPKLKAALIWVLVIFAVYAIVTSPDRAADIVEGIWDVIVGAFRSIGQFFSSLLACPCPGADLEAGSGPATSSTASGSSSRRAPTGGCSSSPPRRRSGA